MLHKGKNVINILCIIGCLFSCRNLQTTQKKNIAIQRLKSEDKKTWLTIQSYDYYDKRTRIPANTIINGIFIDKEYINITEGVFNIRSLFLGKEDVVTKGLQVKWGDSIVISQYMEDSSKPMF